jgi:hypothetical protein
MGDSVTEIPVLLPLHYLDDGASRNSRLLSGWQTGLSNACFFQGFGVGTCTAVQTAEQPHG